MRSESSRKLWFSGPTKFPQRDNPRSYDIKKQQEAKGFKTKKASNQKNINYIVITNNLAIKKFSFLKILIVDLQPLTIIGKINKVCNYSFMVLKNWKGTILFFLSIIYTISNYQMPITIIIL